MRKIFIFFRWTLAVFLTTTLYAVVIYGFAPVFVTPLMGIRCVQQIWRGESPVCRHEWIPLEEMPRDMIIAVMASEDARFLDHHGFDMKAIQQASEYNRTHERKLGASTISQQTAKNVFLWPDRTWVRKGFESYFTMLMEAMWTKRHIMEVYLNSIEMGDGIYGISAVARHHFHKPASELTRAECALIAASLPNPLKHSSAHPDEYLRKRQARIEHEMKFVKSGHFRFEPR